MSLWILLAVSQQLSSGITYSAPAKKFKRARCLTAAFIA